MIKFSSNDIFWILLFLYYSFGVEKTNTFIRSRGSLENHTRFKTNGQSLYPFSDQNGSKTIPFGAAHTYIAPRPGDLFNCSLGNHCSRIQYCPYSLNIVPYPAISTMTSCLLAFRGLQLRFHKCYHVRINRD